MSHDGTHLNPPLGKSNRSPIESRLNTKIIHVINLKEMNYKNDNTTRDK